MSRGTGTSPRAGILDFAGRTSPERDLLGALERIAAAGLTWHSHRPRPFITAEWRDGGIPAWLWQEDPSMLALDARGRPAGAHRPYPALTYPHPAYETAAVASVGTAIGAAARYLASRGGPIVHLQLDDEPSWWQQLRDPLALDYSPFLVAPTPNGPSRYAAWLLERHGQMATLDRLHRTSFRTPGAVEPPRQLRCRSRAAATISTGSTSSSISSMSTSRCSTPQPARRGSMVRTPMLSPYLLPLQAARFAAFARERLPDLG